MESKLNIKQLKNFNFFYLKKFAVCKKDKILLYHTPGRSKEFNPFLFQRTFYGAYDENVCLDWTSDSRVLIAGSKDMSSCM
jgi:periodic tryptophan protein 2